MAINKFYSGTPYYHQENLTHLFGHHVGASTIFNQCEYVADHSMPIFYELQRQAAVAHLFLVDDTRHRILTQEPELRSNPTSTVMAIIRHIALNLLQLGKQKRQSIKGSRKICSWDNNFLSLLVSKNAKQLVDK